MLTSQAGAMGRDSDLSGADRYYLPCVAPKRLGLYLEHTANKYHLLLFSLIFVLQYIASTVYFLRRKTLCQVCLLQPRRRDTAVQAPG